MSSEVFGDDLPVILPVIERDCSDSGEFDNAMEMLMMSGRDLPEVVMMMIPEAWRNHRSMPEHKRAFYEYHACLQEPWDGPASISFTDGRMIGAVLDRNGLRPSRYYVTSDDRVVMASEVGVLDIDPADVVRKGRLEPGKMFLVDFERGCIVADNELKDQHCQPPALLPMVARSTTDVRRFTGCRTSRTIDHGFPVCPNAGFWIFHRNDGVHAAADGEGQERPHWLHGQ